MPVYQHLIRYDSYVCSKLKSIATSTEPWSTVEQESPFEITETTVDPVEEDTQVDVRPEGDEILVWVSQIDDHLLPIPGP